MNETRRIANHISSLCRGPWLPHYTSSKLRTDPLYSGVHTELLSSRLPLLDIGCGLGILPMYLRERGFENDIHGIDFDPSKIKTGRHMLATGRYHGITLDSGDARISLPPHLGDVTILDILQFFTAQDQCSLLKSAASRVAPGGKLIIRNCLQGSSARFHLTRFIDVFSRCTFWMKAGPVCYPDPEVIRESLTAAGLSVTIRPFWGKTPFNNHLITACRLE